MRMLQFTGFTALTVAILVVLTGTPGWAADDRMAVPSDAEVTAKQALIKDTYKADYAKTTTAARAALAQKLLQLARDTKDDPVGRYVLLLEARDLGARGADGLTAMSAADELANDYRVPPGQVRAAIADTLANASNTPQSATAAAQVLLSGAASAREADDWDSAITLCRAAGNAARKIGPGNKLSETAAARLKEAEYLKGESVKVKVHLETLKTKPDDPEANLAVGKYEFVGKEEFGTGVKYLAKSSDAKLKDAAEKDLKAEEGSEAEQLTAGDAWYDLAASADPLSKPAYQIRAHHWYVEVLPDVTGLNKTKVEKRVNELQPIVENRADRNAIYVTIRKAVADKQYKKWGLIGGAFSDTPFDDIPTEGAILIGFNYTTVSRGQYPGVVQPIWLTARGEVAGKTIYGVATKDDSPKMTTKAKPGYAVGAIYVRGGGGFDAFKPIYMRMTSKGVDVTDKYEGPHIGGKGGGDGTVGGDGSFIIGLHGKLGQKMKMETISVVTMGGTTRKKSKK